MLCLIKMKLLQELVDRFSSVNPPKRKLVMRKWSIVLTRRMTQTQNLLKEC